MANPTFLAMVKLPMTSKPTMSSEGDLRATYEDVFALQNTIRILIRTFTEDSPPADNVAYVRENNTWVPLEDAVKLEWGAITGTLADQLDLVAVLATKVDEAPQDGKLYGRRNGAWEEIVLP